MKNFPPVLVLYNQPPEEGALESQSDVLATVNAVCEVLSDMNVDHRMAGVRTLHDVTLAMRAGSAPIVFNLVEEIADGAEEYNYIPAVCEAFGKHVTGSGVAALLLTQDKWKTKCLLRGAGILVPEGVIYNLKDNIDPPLFKGPYFVKPVGTDASEGIEAGCVFEKFTEEMRKRIDSLRSRFHQAVLVEQFINGREFNVSVLEGVGVLPVAEIDFSGLDDPLKRIVDYSAKWKEGSEEYRKTRRVVPAEIPEKVSAEAGRIALESFRLTGCRDYARVDMRMDQAGKIFVLEVNANPGIAPDSGFVAALQAGGRTFSSFVKGVLKRAAKKLDWIDHAEDRSALDEGEFKVRRTWKRDIGPIMHFLQETNFFRDDEVQTAREVLLDALGGGEAGHYHSWTCCEGSRPVGWICCGATPCTVGTYDIYWLAVHPQLQRRGLGKILVETAEKFVRGLGGKTLIIETSGKPIYESTRGFYHHMGFIIQARIPDFYAPEDDKIIYVKRLS